MDLNRATALVAADVRESYPDLTDADAIQHAIDTVDPQSVQENDELADAYRMVLAQPRYPNAPDYVNESSFPEPDMHRDGCECDECAEYHASLDKLEAVFDTTGGLDADTLFDRTQDARD